MSYTIIYQQQFLNLGDKYLPLVIMGDNNVWELNNKRRSRDWQHLSILPKVGTQQQLLDAVQEFRENFSHKENYTDEKFGYFSGIAIGGKSTHATTFGNLLGLVKSGIKYALTIEQLTKYGYNLIISTSHYYDNRLVELGLPHIHAVPETTGALQEILTKIEKYKGVTINFGLTISENDLKWLRCEYFPQATRAKKPEQEVQYYFILVNELNHVFVKKTKYGYKYIDKVNSHVSRVKKFKTEKQAHTAMLKLNDTLFKENAFSIERVDRVAVI